MNYQQQGEAASYQGGGGGDIRNYGKCRPQCLCVA